MSKFIRFESNSTENYQASYNKVKGEVDYCYFVPPNKKKVCVDIGSNMGAFIHRMSEEDAFEEIYGFEPSFQTYHASLSILGELDILNPSRRIFNLAVADKTGEIYTLFDGGDGDSGCASLLPSQKSTQKENCMSISLDDIFDLAQVDYIDYLKIDCEGAELGILQNSKRLGDIGAMMVECHYVDGVDTTPYIIKILNANGFHVNCFKATEDVEGTSHADRMKGVEPVLFAVDAKKYQEDYSGWYRLGVVDEEETKVSIGDIEKHNNGRHNEYREACERNQNVQQKETI